MSLFRDRRFALLFVGQALNGIGSWAALIAMWGYAAYKFDSSGTGVAILGLCWSAPGAVLGPLAGIPIDRLGPKRVLIAAYIAGAVTAFAMGFARTFGELAALGLLYGFTKAFAAPAADSLPPRIVPEDRLLAANAMLGAASESAIVFGPLVAAGAIAVGGLRTAFFVDAVTYLIGAAAVAPLVLSKVDTAERVRLRTELAEGWRLVTTTPMLRYVLTLSTAVFVTWAAFMVIEPLYARDVLETSASQFAMFQVAFGVALVLTSLVLPRLGDRVAGPRPLALSVVLSGLTAGLYVGTHSVWFAYAGVFLWGVDVAFFAAPSRTLLQKASPVHAHGRVLSLYRTAHSVADVAVLPLAGVAVAGVGVQTTGLVVAAFAVLIGLTGLVLVPAGSGAEADGADAAVVPVAA